MVIQRNEWADVATGAVVLAVALGFLTYAMGLVGAFGAADGVRNYRVSLVEAQGVRTGTDVRVSGITIGQVGWLELNPETFAAETELALDGAYDFPEDSVAVVASEGLLGGRFVEIIPGSSSFPLEPGGRFRTMVPETNLIDLLLQALNGRR
ncbi:MlaD family protein [Maritimibacter dapengensis]|uniref:MCE family protein n=1 Tax=Maritimibacter dapengensis TaxID=2836868 RepID=A0ABS6T0W3_9RHOB|nr:MlaD family protein [Maritimibacter dapengensis]MBV7378032.1 MCE family protein [Maritimibacter dapengensis]